MEIECGILQILFRHISYADITTGEFNSAIIEHTNESLTQEIVARNIKEIVNIVIR